jgi:hypothetical protein
MNLSLVSINQFDEGVHRRFGLSRKQLVNSWRLQGVEDAGFRLVAFGDHDLNR